MDFFELFSDPQSAVFVVGAVAIVVGGAVAITKAVLRHRERIAMIENGMHPDAYSDEETSEQGGA